MTRVDEFDYSLPEELIATEPAPRRDASRLLVLEAADGRIRHRSFDEIPRFLRGGDALVLNESRVFKARLPGHRETGGTAEALFLRPLGGAVWLALIGTRGKVRPGEYFLLADGALRIRTLEKDDVGRWSVEAVDGDVERVMDERGMVPLPPYITRKRGTVETTRLDVERYQTVYAARTGSVAAPTAGLHFTSELLERLAADGVRVLRVTLHIGYETFRPVRTGTVEEHRMHAERYEVASEVMDALEETRAAGGRVVAVGTTSVRVLETLARGAPPAGWTDIFIYPPFRFRLTDALITNFHLPRSTLLMLVCAFGGRENVMAAYREAVRLRYRFYSYGDAMLIV